MNTATETRPDLVGPPNPWHTPRALAETLSNDCGGRPPFSVHSIRHMSREPEKYGLEDAVRRIGRKVLIHKYRFLDAIDRHTARGGRERAV